MTTELDIVIPVYNEGRNIGATLGALVRSVNTPARVFLVLLLIRRKVRKLAKAGDWV